MVHHLFRIIKTKVCFVGFSGFRPEQTIKLQCYDSVETIGHIKTTNKGPRYQFKNYYKFENIIELLLMKYFNILLAVYIVWQAKGRVIFTFVSKLKEESFLLLVSYLCLLLLGSMVLIDRRSIGVLDPGKLRFLLVSMTSFSSRSSWLCRRSLAFTAPEVFCSVWPRWTLRPSTTDGSTY